MSLSVYNSPAYTLPLAFTAMSLLPPIFASNTPPISNQVHPREKELEELLESSLTTCRINRVKTGILVTGLIPSLLSAPSCTKENPDEYFKLDGSDPKKKVLFLSAKYANNSDILDAHHVVHVLKEINKKYDLRYHVVESPEDICNEINEASKLGQLNNVFIQSLSNSTRIFISGVDEVETLHENSKYLECFKAVNHLGKITLLSENVGAPTNGDPYNNLAQRIATAAKCIVIAPTNVITSRTFIVPTIAFTNQVGEQTDPVELFQYDTMTIWTPLGSSILRGTTNAFRLFYPTYSECPTVKETEIHPRERVAVEVIRDEILKNSTLLQPTELKDWLHLLSFCHKDPRKKLLFFSFDSDYNNALDPKFHAHLLSSLATHYDMKYEVVYLPNQICRFFREAAEAGEFTDVIFHAHGDEDGMCLIGKGKKYFTSFHRYMYLKECLKGLSDSGKITIISCSVGKDLPPGEGDNMATTMAKACNKTVIAAKDLSSPQKLKLISPDPVELYHPGESQTDNIYEAFRG